MDVKATRKRNLRALIFQEAKAGEAYGAAARLAVKIGTAPAYISQLLSDKAPSGKKKPGMGDELARQIERRLGLSHGWMDVPHYPRVASPPAVEYDREEHEADPSLIVNEPAEFPLKGGGIELDRLDVRASMGGGIPMPERETVIDSIRVPMEWVHEHFPHITAAKNLKIITGFGDSMLPTYKHGDPLIVDTGVNAMDVDTVYVFAYQEELYIKRIQRLPDKSIKVISDNRALYEPFTLDAKQRQEVHVIARVICAVNMNKIA